MSVIPLGIRTLNPQRSQNNQTYVKIGQAWTSMDATQRNPWMDAALHMAQQATQATASGAARPSKAQSGKTRAKLTLSSTVKPRAMNAYQCFASINTTRLTCLMDVTTTCPPIVAPPALPKGTLEATHTLNPEGTFNLFFRSAAYSGLVLVYATAPLLINQSQPVSKAMPVIAISDGLILGGTALTESYLAHFRAPAVNEKVLVELVPVTAGGVRGTSVIYSAVTGIVTLEDAAPTETDPLSRAA